MRNVLRVSLVAISLALCGAAAQAGDSVDLISDLCEVHKQTSASFRPIVTRGDVEVFEEEIRAILAQVPARHVARYAHSDQMLERLQQMSLSRLIAQDALESGILEEPLVAARLVTVISETLAAAKREMIRQPESIDKFARRAEELYLTEPDRFRVPGSVSLDHLFISKADRTDAEAARLMLDLYDQLREGSELDWLIAEYSEDDNQPADGYKRIDLDGWPDKFLKIINRAEPGSEILGPFSTSEGWHLVRLNERHEGEVLDWEESSERIIEMVAREHHADKLRRYIRDISQPTPELNEEALERIRDEYSN